MRITTFLPRNGAASRRKVAVSGVLSVPAVRAALKIETIPSLKQQPVILAAIDPSYAGHAPFQIQPLTVISQPERSVRILSVFSYYTNGAVVVD